MKYILVSARYSLNKKGEVEAYSLENYLHEINIRGYVPILLSHETISSELINNASGFLISGGFDINPRLYHESSNFELEIRDKMDELDYLMISEAIKSKKPLLGICRGHQIVNVYFGSSLIQDVEGHKNTRHVVERVVDNDLTKVLGSSFEVNSFHHQVVKECKLPMIVTYKAVDGMIEGSMHETLPIITVQWHPEKDPLSVETKKIFDYFINLVKNN